MQRWYEKERRDSSMQLEQRTTAGKPSNATATRKEEPEAAGTNGLKRGPTLAWHPGSECNAQACNTYVGGGFWAGVLRAWLGGRRGR